MKAKPAAAESASAEAPSAPAAPATAEVLGTNSIGMFKADEDQARKISAENLRGLGISLEELGDLSGIVWNERTGLLVCGHQRMDRLRAAGVTEWNRSDKTSGYVAHPKSGERFAVRIVDWDDAKARLANIVANNPELQGEFTDELQGQLAELSELEEMTKMEALRLTELMAEEEDRPEPRERRTLEDFDTTPAPKKAWILIATNDEVAAQLEAELRDKWEGGDTRVEVSYGVR